VPSSLVVTLTARQQALILAQLRQARYGHLLSLHILLLLHHGYSPTHIAACLFCSRSSVYRSVTAWRSGALHWTVPAVPAPVLVGPCAGRRSPPEARLSAGQRSGCLRLDAHPLEWRLFGAHLIASSGLSHFGGNRAALAASG
jgi:Homeodomain-like domain